jgi:hypothetical protein
MGLHGSVTGITLPFNKHLQRRAEDGGRGRHASVGTTIFIFTKFLLDSSTDQYIPLFSPI